MTKIFAGAGLLLMLSMCQAHADELPALIDSERQQLSTAVRAYFPTPAHATKAIISFHHALLESHREQGYLILSLSSGEQQQLIDAGFTLSPANDWQQQRHHQLDQLLAQHQSQASSPRQAKTDTINSTIPGFSCYPSLGATYLQAKELADHYPSLASWIDIGDSWEKTKALGGQDLRVLKLTNQLTNQQITTEKPKLFIHSAMHAREYATAPLTLAFARNLLEGYQSQADIRWILDAHEVHLLFHMNPDGREYAETGLLWRKNTNQDHCGIDSPQRGVDLNRNFTHFWNSTTDGSSGEQCDNTYRGPTPASEPETRAVETYLRSLFADRRGPLNTDAAPDDTQGMHIDIHSFSELVLWPWGQQQGQAPNGQALATLGRKLAYFNGYLPIQGIGLYPTDGTSESISYGELGIPAYTFEIGTEFFQSCGEYEQKIKPDNLKALLYAAKVIRAPYLLPAGPDSTLVRVNRVEQAILPQGTPVELTATLTDTRYQHSAGTEPTQGLSQAEYYLDIPPWEDNAAAIPLTADDGAFDQKTEAVSATINTNTMALGEHMLYTRGQDSDGNWGPVSAVFLTIGDNILPEAAFSQQCNANRCQFNASASSDSDGDVAHYHWDLGQGTTLSGQSPFHTFSEPGPYQIILTITDSRGAKASVTQSVDISLPEPPPEPEPQPKGSSGGVLFSLIGWLGIGLWIRRRGT